MLSFNHKQGPQGSWYSSIGVTGSEQLLAAPGSRHWMPQLVPEIYDYDRRQAGPVPTSAGLIGDLPILFGLVAFSAPPEQLSHVLISCMQPNAWLPHRYPHSRRSCAPSMIDVTDTVEGDTERGMVITVFFDPNNEQGSNKKLLDSLQQGHFGPFYRA